jgi:LysM repeat protein
MRILMDFQDLQRRYDELREQFDAGKISEKEFKGEIEGLQFKDEQGRYWTIGAQTGQWYHFDGRGWVQETPLPMTKHQGRGIPEEVSAVAASQAARSQTPSWLYTGCGGALLLLVVAGLIIGAVTLLRGREEAVSGQVATPTLSSGVPANTPTLGPIPSPTATVPPTDTPLALKTYSNSVFGFSLQYPSDWRVKETNQQVTLASDSEALTTSIVDDVTVPGGIVFVVGRETENNIQESSGVLAQLIAGLPTDASASETGFRTVDQVEWSISQVKLDESDSAQEMTAYVAAAYYNDTAYTVLAAAPTTDWDTFAPILQQMFDSLKFAPPQVAAARTPTATKIATLTRSVTTTPITITPDVPAVSPTPVVYVVEQGDTLGAIAFQFGVSVEAIQSANGIDDPAKLRVGQELIVPVGGSIPAATPTTATTPTTGTVTATASSPTPETTSTPAPTPTPAEVVLSGKIVFPVFDPNRTVQEQLGPYDIWMSDPQGNNRQVLVPNASQPHLNSGGDLLAYRSWDASGRGVAFLTIGGGRGAVLSRFLEDGLPSWAPDSVTMALASRRESDRIPRLYRMNQVTGEDRSLDINGEYVSTFLDGRLVLKGCTVEGLCGLFITGPDGGTLDLISDNAGDTAPAPSPDGAQIAFMSPDREGSGNWEIYVMNSNGTGVTRLTNNKANDGLPAWSPDGSTIAFASDRDGAWAIWAMNPDGTNQRKLFDMGGSPDGLVGFDVNNSKGWVEERISWGP